MRKLILLAMLPLAACAPKSKPAAPVPAVDTTIQVCVVDTLAPGGMMSIEAIAAGATGDTVILQPEGRMPIAKAVAGPKVLADATWITKKTPLTLTAASGRRRYTPDNGPRTFAPGNIILLGMMRGVPLFARGNEGGAMRPELESLAARGIDIEKALQQRATLRRQMDNVRFIYIPTALVGCQFQQFSRLKR